jgi:hypothetical protein
LPIAIELPFHHRMAAALDFQRGFLAELGLAVVVAHRGGGEGGESIEFGDGAGDALQDRNVDRQPRPAVRPTRPFPAPARVRWPTSALSSKAFSSGVM